MLAVALVLIALGVILGLILPPFGFVPALVGVVLLVLFLVGLGRRAGARET